MNPKLHEQFDKFKSSGLLPPPKGSIRAVVKPSQQDDATNQQLAHVIQIDPSLVARLLKLTYAQPRPELTPSPGWQRVHHHSWTQQTTRTCFGLFIDEKPASDRRRCMSAGGDDFLTKPLSIEMQKVSLMKWPPVEPSV